MIQLAQQPLPSDAAKELQQYQQEVDAILPYKDRVQRGKKDFSKYNKTDDRVFKSVRATLTLMCSGSRRCMYCEDSCADEVEHIKPKDLYPESVFKWENYLYACGICNREKSNAFAVFVTGTGKKVIVTRKKDDPIVPPVAGDNVFLDPRIENPLSFLALDLRDTFKFVPFPGISPKERERAIYTRDTLQLDREVLVEARRQAYGSYKARLHEYIVERNKGRDKSQLDQLVRSLQRLQHPTVWLEMQRQYDRVPDLIPLFAQVPEAFIW